MRNFKVVILRSLAVVAGACLAFALNRYLAVNLGFGVQFLAGQCVAIVFMRFVGWRDAMAVSAGGGVATIMLWNHPWAGLVLLAEIAVISWLTRTRNLDIFTSDVIFWCFVGAPLLAATYGLVLGMAFSLLSQVILKQALNGLALASLVSILLAMSPRRLQVRPSSLKTLLVEFAVPFTTFTAFVFMAIVAFDVEKYLLQRSEMTARLEAERYTHKLVLWKAAVQNDIVGMARYRRKGHGSNLDHAIERKDDAWLRELPLYLADISGNKIEVETSAESPKDFGAFRPDPGMHQAIMLTWRSYASDFKVDFDHDGKGQTYFVLGVPIIEKQELIAAAYVIFPFSTVTRILNTMMPIEMPANSIIIRDSNAMGILPAHTAGAIASNTQKEVLLVQRDYLLPTTHIQLDASPRLSLMQAWHGGFLNVDVRVADDWPWVVTFKFSLASVVQQTMETLNGYMVIIFVMIAVAILSARFLARGFVGPVKNLLSKIDAIPNTRLAPGLFDQSQIGEFNAISSRLDKLNNSIVLDRREAWRQERRLQHLVRNAPVVLCNLVVDPKGSFRTTFMSDNIEQLCGYSSGEMRHLPFRRAFVHPADIPLFDRAMSEAGTTGTCSVQYRFRCGNGRYRWLREDIKCLIPPEAMSGDHIKEAIGVIADITVHKEAELSVLQSSKLITLGEMASSIAHELNQPLNVIAMASENIRNHIAKRPNDMTVWPYAEQKLERILGQVRRAAGIINQLRKFSRLPEAAPQLHTVAEVFSGVMVLVGEQLRLADIGVVQRIDDDLEPICVHRQQIEQVLVNLLINARDAILARASTDIPGEIVIEATKATDGKITISVSDNGGGIPAEIFHLIFDPFFTTKPANKGTGLGLYISQQIATETGGMLTACNSRKGAVFQLKLPTAVDQSNERPKIAPVGGS